MHTESERQEINRLIAQLELEPNEFESAEEQAVKIIKEGKNEG